MNYDTIISQLNRDVYGYKTLIPTYVYYISVLVVYIILLAALKPKFVRTKVNKKVYDKKVHILKLILWSVIFSVVSILLYTLVRHFWF